MYLDGADPAGEISPTKFFAISAFLMAFTAFAVTHKPSDDVTEVAADGSDVAGEVAEQQEASDIL